MSLDVTIKYKSPCKERYGDTHGFCGDYKEEEVSEWHANITHNMGEMADKIPVKYNIEGEDYDESLYNLVWKPDEIGDGVSCRNTNVMEQALRSGIAYMVLHRDELEKFNPENGWGSYDGFLNWLIAYWRVCIQHPDCEIEADR